MRTGTITHINRTRGMFIVRSVEGESAVFELLGSIELAVGDRIQGALDAEGPQVLLHLGERQSFRVIGQSGPSSLEACLNVISAT